MNPQLPCKQIRAHLVCDETPGCLVPCYSLDTDKAPRKLTPSQPTRNPPPNLQYHPADMQEPTRLGPCADHEPDVVVACAVRGKGEERDAGAGGGKDAETGDGASAAVRL